MLRVVIADQSDGVVEYIRSRLWTENDVEVVATAGDGEQAIRQAMELQPDIAVVEASLVGDDGVPTGPAMAQRLPQTRVIVMSMREPGVAARQAMDAAAVGFLLKPFTADEALAAIRRASSRRFDLAQLPPAEATAGVEAPQEEPDAYEFPADLTASARPTAPPSDGAEGDCEVFTVFSPEGGVGKSVVAVNLAVALAMSSGRRVALLDLSLQFGDIAAMLNLHGDRTIADLASDDACSDPGLIDAALVEGPEGVRVLLAPMRPELADYVTTLHVRSLVDQLRRTFAYVVIDTPSYLNDITIDAIELADEVVMLTSFSVTSIKNARLALSVMDALKIERRQVHLIANHSAAGRPAFDQSEAQGHLKQPIACELPHDPSTVNASINRGVPFVVGSAAAPVSRSIVALAASLAPAGQPTPASVHAKGRFSPRLHFATR